jgi:hypothetical protein
MRVPQVSERIKEAPAQALRGVFAGIGQLLLITDKLRHKTPAHEDVPRARTPETAPAITDAPVTRPAGSHQETTAAARPAAAKPAAGQVVTAEPAAEPASAASTEALAKPAAAKRTAGKAAAAKSTAARSTARPATGRRAAAKPAADPEGAEASKPPKRQSTRNFDKTGNVRLLADETDSAPEPIAAEPIAAPEPIGTFEPTVVAEPVAATEPVIVSRIGAPEPVAAPEPMAATEPEAATEPPLPNYDALTVASLRARLRNLDVAQLRQLVEYERAHAGRADVLGMYERRIARLEAEA